MPADLTAERIAELRLGCGVATLRERLVVSTPEEMLALLDAAERVRQLEAVLRKYEYRMHASGCSSYWTTNDDVSEQFDSEKCDCGFAALLNPEERHAR